MYALTEIKGVGRRYANIVCKKADVDLKKRCVLRFCLVHFWHIVVRCCCRYHYHYLKLSPLPRRCMHLPISLLSPRSAEKA